MFPKDKAAEIAVSTVREWLDAHHESTVERVIFNVLPMRIKRFMTSC